MNPQIGPSAENRALAAASYLVDLTPLGLLGAVAVLLVRGRESRFIGVHAAQALIVSISLRLAVHVATPIATLAPLPGPGVMLVNAFLSILPTIVTAWLGFSAFQGRPAAVRILGPWSERLVDRAAT